MLFLLLEIGIAHLGSAVGSVVSNSSDLFLDGAQVEH